MSCKDRAPPYFQSCHTAPPGPQPPHSSWTQPKNTKQKDTDRQVVAHQLTGRFGITGTSGVPELPPGRLGHPYLEPSAAADGVKPRAHSYENLLRNSSVLMCCQESFSSSISDHLWPQPQHSSTKSTRWSSLRAPNSLPTARSVVGTWGAPLGTAKGTHGWKHPNVGGHDFTSGILQSLVFYCNYVLATNYRRGKWLWVLLSLTIQHKSHRAAVAEMMKYLYCCFSITGVS